jgi:hypothetical protein
MALPVSANRSPVGIAQKTLAGGTFTGAKPETTPAISAGFNVFPDSNVAGLFDFEQDAPMTVLQYQFDLGASVAYALSIVNLDAAGAVVAGSAIQIAAATAQYVFDRTPFILMPRQALQLTVAGAAARRAQVVAVIKKD